MTEQIKALKYDQGNEKLPWDLTPWLAVEGMVRVLLYGKRKYSICSVCSAKIYPNPKLDGDPPRTDCPECGETKIRDGAHNWRNGFDWTRILAATQRHLLAIMMGEDIDSDSGELHVHHLMCCVAFLSEHQQLGLGTDDRQKYPPRS